MPWPNQPELGHFWPLQGKFGHWIQVGSPVPGRLHRAGPIPAGSYPKKVFSFRLIDQGPPESGGASPSLEKLKPCPEKALSNPV